MSCQRVSSMSVGARISQLQWATIRLSLVLCHDRGLNLLRSIPNDSVIGALESEIGDVGTRVAISLAN